MKTTIMLILFVLVASVAVGQQVPVRSDGEFIPRTLSAGTSMSARTAAAALDDTTQAFSLDGWNRAFVHIVTATNDSSNTWVAYQTSLDNITWGDFTVIDSLKSTGTVGANKAFEIPAGAMGAEYCRIRVYGSTGGVPYSANPSTTVKTIIRRKH